MWRIIPIAIAQSIFLAGGQVLLKLGLAASGPFSWSWSFFKAQLTNWWFLGCGISFSVATVLWLYILKHFPFSMAYPMVSLSYVFGMIAAMLVFHEEVSLVKWAGVLLIMAGCYLIAK